MKLSKQSKKIFTNIENVRKKNNKNWMDLLRLSYEVKPKATIGILSKILQKDGELIKLANQLKKITK